MIEKMFAAKSDNTSSHWLPLWMHLEDTAGIMKKLLDDFVSESFCISCGLSIDELRKTALFIAYTHDIGKATILFQHKIGICLPERYDALEHYGLKLPETININRESDSPHALAGEEILLFLGFNPSIAAVVGSHHGVPAEGNKIAEQNLAKKRRIDIVGLSNYYGETEGNRGIITDSWRKIADNALKYAGLSSADELPVLSTHAQMVLCGLLIAADWIASNTSLFPLISIDEDVPREYPYPERTDSAWEKLDFPDMWQSCFMEYSNTAFKESFGFTPSEIQRCVLDIAEKAVNPGIYILEAPMGCGKTEAALSAAEVLAAKFGKNGLFFGLPTQATANGIFPRIKDWAEKKSVEDYHSIRLQHGSAPLNKTFQKISKSIPAEESDSGLVAHSWFCDRKKACLADFVVATVDNMLMMALKRKHVMLLHLGLSEKVVVIDEVHAYDAYMNKYLERALQWLGAYRTPVILLSATLPAKRRMKLIKAYMQNKKADKVFEENMSYPLLTWTDGGEVKQTALPYNGSHKSVRVRKIRNDEAVSAAERVVRSGGCVGIIMNTVKRAQNMAELIRNSVTDDILLYHAQYIMTDRIKKEEELLERIGKSSTYELRKGLVVVGSQVLEQSLDIDFDLLITDICPIDLLLQRMGRLHRHERDNRPDCAENPVCCVITDEFHEEKTGSKYIYSEWLLSETMSKLPDTVMLPDDISPLVQEVYNAADDSEIYKEYFDSGAGAENRADAFLLPKPPRSKYDPTIHGLLSRNVSDAQAEASVRDGISSVEVIVMQKLCDNTVRFIDGGILSPELTEDECMRIA